MKDDSPSSFILHPSSESLRRLGLTAAGRLLPRAPSPPNPPRRLLLIRPDHLGDVLLAAPAIALMREALPGAHLTLMVGPWSLEVARRAADVDEIVTCQFPGFTRRAKRHPLEPYQVLWRFARRLRGRYDLALILRPDHWWGALLAAVAGVPCRLGWDLPATRPLLSEALLLPPSVHVAELNLRLARRAVALALAPTGGAAGPSATPAGQPANAASWTRAAPLFRVTPDERAWAEAIATSDSRPLVLLHPSSGSPLKNWPPDRWAAVADALAKQGARIVVSGGGDDLASPAAVAAAMHREALLLAGATTLGQLAALAQRAVLALGTDNGPLHLAAAVGTPTLRLYGPTDQTLFGPWGESAAHRVLTHELPCRPCGNLLAPPCGAHEQPPCLLGLATESGVEAALAHFLDVTRARPAPGSECRSGPAPRPIWSTFPGELS